MAKAWEFKGDRNGVVELRSLPGLRLTIATACREIAESAAQSTGARSGPVVPFSWDMPAGFRWEVGESQGRTGYAGGVVASHPTAAGRKRARAALRAAMVAKGAKG